MAKVEVFDKRRLMFIVSLRGREHSSCLPNWSLEIYFNSSSVCLTLEFTFISIRLEQLGILT